MRLDKLQEYICEIVPLVKPFANVATTGADGICVWLEERFTRLNKEGGGRWRERERDKHTSR